MALPKVLMVAEKPSIALSIATVLSHGKMNTRRGSTEVHEFDGKFRKAPGRFKVTSVIGHVFSVDFPGKYQDWAATDPLDLFQAQVIKNESNPKAHICKHLHQEARGCRYLVLWLDCDREGENICFEVIESTGFNINDVYRARFSSVTEKDVLNALDNLVRPNRDEAMAVDARQEIDLKVGVAFTRFQTSFFQGKYGNLDARVISYGPCQTPTLGFCVQRYLQINTFKPEKFWSLQPYIIKSGYEILLEWQRSKLFDINVAMMFQKLVADDGIVEVTNISEKPETKGRPVGLNTVNLLKVASSALGFGPQMAMQLAERLYTQGFISYPRTESTAYPPSFDFRSALSAQRNNPTWGNYVEGLLASGYQKPRSGTDVGDHPPITPMKSASEDMLGNDAWKLYQYICQYFIGTVSPDCKYIRKKVEFQVGGESFHCTGQHVITKGFTAIMPWLAINDKSLPSFEEGQKIKLSKVELYEGSTTPPDFLTESELISLMEKNGIGTDASIPVHINNICERNYVQVQAGRKLSPTTLGITLVRGYQSIDPDLCLPDIRSFIEQQITLIAKGQVDHHRVVQHVIEQFKQKFCYFVKKIEAMDALFEAQFSALVDSGRIMSKCGKCLRYMKYISVQPSRLYCGTCEEVYDLPQKGTIKLYKELTCPLDNFELLICSMPGQEGKSFPLCPYCYSNPPFEGIDTLINSAKTTTSSKTGKGAGMPCNLCPHPTCPNSLVSQGVCACPECSGTLVLDPVSAPKWRLCCNMCNCLVFLAQGAHRISTTKERCPECDSSILEVDFNKKTTPLADGSTLHRGCILCDVLLHSLVEMKYGRGFKSSRGRGRGGRTQRYRGRGRGNAKMMDPKMSFRAHANSSTDVSALVGSVKARQTAPPSHLGLPINAGVAGNSSDMAVQQFSLHGRDAQGSLKQLIVGVNGMPSMHPQQSSANKNLGADSSLNAKASSSRSDPEPAKMQYVRQLSQHASLDGGSTKEAGSGNYAKPQGGPSQMPQKLNGFTKNQLHVLKAQILAFRRLKKGDGILPQELLEAISPPPLDLHVQQPIHSAGAQNQDKSMGNSVAEQPRQNEPKAKDSQPIVSFDGDSSEQETFVRDQKSTGAEVHMQAMLPVTKVSAGKEDQQSAGFSAKSDKKSEHVINRAPVINDLALDKGKAIASQALVTDTAQINKPAQSSTVVGLPKDAGPAKKYYGPLFDFPFFTRKQDSFGSSMMANNNNNLSLAYDVKELLYEEGTEVFNKRRTENLKKIEGLLAVNLERKRIRPDLVLKLQIEEKKLRLLDLQARLRGEIDQQQQEIMAMPDRPYRKFVKLCERQRVELARQVQTSQKALREKQLKSIFQWRKKLLEVHWAIRDARTARNRGVAKYHEKMLKEFSKNKDDDRNKRMEALKNNDVDRYREMLLEQQTSLPGDAAERYNVLSTFLTQTEEYLQKLGSKITSAKNQQEVEESAKAAAAAARLQGLSEEEVRAAAACAAEEVMIRNRFMEMNAPKDGSSSVSKYYNLAHAVNEKVLRQPSMLRAGTLREYQLVGLQWMLSLYNNKLNGILADEMGLGKTVQVMALIAYLMEFKGNYGPHLIIVPNAVLVNWKSELHTWLPSVSCIFYVGSKDHRSKLFSQEVMAMKFNVLVTTYEFIMYDRSKLSKIDWRYVIIDEAQRMKDRESVLARDLDRYRCHRRLLLTGTPLQNDLKELWSLLNLLLPEVFDNKKAFNDWFSKPFQKEDPNQNAEDDWLETEKKVIIIHRLHQILEPFMLRRRVEEVEGSLPPKVSIVLRCRMSAFQSAIYDWIKSTGTLRLNPEEEQSRMEKSPLYQAKQYKTLNNRCMELRKTCNHPLLNYPFFSDLSKDFMVKCCGKLWMLDRILIKLQRTGHRVLLFSTMTKLLDILEEYLQWRRLVYRRIDGTTALEDRESAIVDFNSPNSDCFIFLLSIRAAGRGLNLQSADTVVIYDPDPNPKNEEQAVARAHRIGQKREVKVIYMEAVVDKISSHQKEDEMRIGGTIDMEDELAGKDRYIGSIESLIRSNIQQYKIDMADEVINAGRFDQRTTHEERRLTLETLLHDEERCQETVHDVPSLQEVNRMIARNEEEVELFDQMDEEEDWLEEMTRYDQVPDWIRASTREVNAAIAASSKRPSKKNALSGGNVVLESTEIGSERRRGRPKGKKNPSYKELEDSSEEISEDRNEDSAHDEGEIVEFEDDGYSGADIAQPVDKDKLDDVTPSDAEYECPRSSSESARNNNVVEGGSSASSAGVQRLTQAVSPSVSSQKFASLSALDAKPSSISKKMGDELEEGEIAVSGESHMYHQQSGSWIHDRDEGEEEQVLQKPKIKRKRSLRVRPRHTMEKPEDKSGSEMASLQRGQSFLLPDKKYPLQSRINQESKTFGDSSSNKHDKNEPILKNKRNLPARKVANASKLHVSPKSSRLNCTSAPSEDNDEYSREILKGKPNNLRGSSAHVTNMTEIIQRRCKSVISKLQRRIDKEGHQIVPLLTDLWKRIENSGFAGGSGNNLLDLRKIDQRINRLEYSGVMEFVFDVQFMLKSAMQFYGYSYEVRTEARKVHDLFFDILKTTLSDIDFVEAKSALSFTSQISANAGASSKQVTVFPSKRKRGKNDMETDPTPTQKPLQRGSTSNSESGRIKVQLPQKASRTGSGSGSAREQLQQDSPSLLTHPGDLVVCKKKRNERGDKSSVKNRIRSAGPVSPPKTVVHTVLAERSPTPGSGSTPRAGHAHTSNGSGGSVGWANPVKRMRTDSGKRRPSHM